ncbi:hypothetical protein HPB49_008231 [Dermacentor silvarum]|uniref:Uncharacterized protein n=1 Tax=Dermacentor silvarum TaxID=543639 RepID=A0ACB8DBC7_DERSI|nr:hypothetical protein HPB49_008231 [Dermacentor silvarum]
MTIKIVIRPKGALHIAKIGSPVVTAAILQAAKLTDEESLEDTVCPNTQQNIVVVSTPHSDHADRYARISSIQVNGVTHENQVTLPNTVKGEPFPLKNSISIQATTLKIPVCIGITQHIYQQEQDNPEIAHLKRENAILRDLLTKLTQQARDLKQSQTPAPTPIAQNTPAPSQEAPTTPAPKKRALQDGATGQVRSEDKDMLISLQTNVSTFQHALDSIQHALIGIVQRVTNLENHILAPPSQSAPVCDPSGTPMVTSTISHHGSH